MMEVHAMFNAAQSTEVETQEVEEQVVAAAEAAAVAATVSMSVQEEMWVMERKVS